MSNPDSHQFGRDIYFNKRRSRLPVEDISCRRMGKMVALMDELNSSEVSDQRRGSLLRRLMVLSSHNEVLTTGSPQRNYLH